MNLKNKDITEGMRVSNGKNELRVVSWDKSYTDCLLNYLDSKGNRYVVAQNYELSGTEKDPQISWMNGRYFTANSDDEAFEEYLNYLGEVNGYDISESLKESKEFFVGDKTAKGFEVCMIEDGKKYYLSKLAKNVVDSDWSSDYTYAKHWKDESKAEEVVDMLNSELKESKKSSRKSLKESVKPINEKNVAKFVDELNKWCDNNIHYKDVDSAKFTKQYGKLYDFGYNWDYSYGDKGDLLVFDKEETLDWYDDEVVVPFIKQLAKKYGWYCEPAHSYADFMFAEL